jgi:hypothetical protein
MFEAMTPSVGVEDIYPQHSFDTLTFLGFGTWPSAEKEAVIRFIAALEAMLPSVPGLESESAQADWRSAAESLRRLSVTGPLLLGTKSNGEVA